MATRRPGSPSRREMVGGSAPRFRALVGGHRTNVDDSTLTARPLPTERLVDTYMDTGDWRIGRSGFVLRVRHRGGRAEVTLKGRDNATHGLRRRLEVTEPLPAAGLG